MKKAKISSANKEDLSKYNSLKTEVLRSSISKDALLGVSKYVKYTDRQDMLILSEEFVEIFIVSLLCILNRQQEHTNYQISTGGITEEYVIAKLKEYYKSYRPSVIIQKSIDWSLWKPVAIVLLFVF